MKKTLRVHTSITDFAPLFYDIEYLFNGLKNTGVDGIELVVGLKSRWSVKKIRYLSEKYSLPIKTIHQPIWSGLGWYFDENFIDIAIALGADKVVYHPLPRMPFTHKRMQAYLKRLSDLQKEKDIEILIENLPKKYNEKFVNLLFPPNEMTNDIGQLFAAAEAYNLKVALDIDHLRLVEPHKTGGFRKMLPKIGNIHLSSFAKNKNHLPLYLGDFQTKQFIAALQSMDYRGYITLEIYYPQLINCFSYDFDAIKRSVEIIKHV